MAALFGFLAFTRAGKTMRAVADNPTLASLKGIDAPRVARIASFVGLGLAGFGGMLIALDTQVDPLTGFRVLLSIFAAAVVGGLGSIPGAVAGAFLVGIGQEMSLLVLPATLSRRGGVSGDPAGAVVPSRAGCSGSARVVTAYLASLLVFAGINALLALGLNVVWGLGGMINLGLAGFFAVGAYASALLSCGLAGRCRWRASRRWRSPPPPAPCWRA